MGPQVEVGDGTVEHIPSVSYPDERQMSPVFGIRVGCDVITIGVREGLLELGENDGKEEGEQVGPRNGFEVGIFVGREGDSDGIDEGYALGNDKHGQKRLLFEPPVAEQTPKPPPT